MNRIGTEKHQIGVSRETIAGNSPAFPQHYPRNATVAEPGMTVRQWYKGMAVCGLVANDSRLAEAVAEEAAEVADALIAEDAKAAERARTGEPVA